MDAVAVSDGIGKRRVRMDADESKEHEDLVKLLYRAVLGREVEDDALKACMAGLAAATPFADIFRTVATSEEACRRPSAASRAGSSEPAAPGDDRDSLVQGAVRLAYGHFLHRQPTSGDMDVWVGAIRAGLPVERFLADIAGCEEARVKAGIAEVGGGLSDGAFVMAAGDALFGRGLMPTETVAWQARLESGELTRDEMIRSVVGERIRAASLSRRDASPHDPDACSILGTSRVLTRGQWTERADELRREGPLQRQQPLPLEERRFEHSGDYRVSMIASLYKGRRFIERFLDNIVSQTLFDHSELIVIDADSPDGEAEVIASYQKTYPNIVYKRINYRLGIYDAWNVGVELSRGRYITNTNLDDLRRCDSIELQADFLDERPDIDVVYQDFFYTFDPDLSFDEVERFGFRSQLPILTPNNLLLFNSPHNAPMWRKDLHGKVGLFDTRYRSAGDYEFWVRCLAAGRSFGKINAPHVVYYQNPDGISTRPDTRGVEEARDILRRYSQRLTRSALVQSRRDLCAGLDIQGEAGEHEGVRPYYDVIQSALIGLGERRTVAAASREGPSDRAEDHR